MIIMFVVSWSNSDLLPNRLMIQVPIFRTNDDGSKPWSVEDIFGLLLFACSLKQVSDSSMLIRFES